ncbi:suppressor of SWI4 1 homolog isoform X5 [Haemorhous mexicanus]|uniref:suppressor of SWI4 1 homolog isoform X5 n=1 Tax=Haemorhous mexicanus TaxID=30427 RepID=UPI0028BD2FE3|nr:suppressor of SWI4 1 homolog isoform X5 [Haemorhous mexicanus]
MGRPGKSRFQRQQRAQARQRSEQEFGSVPHSFVFARGRPGRSLRSLCRDLRRVLEPFTARSLQVRRSNSLRDLLAVAGPLGVTQFLALSKSQSGVNLKLFRLPGGPTLTFKVLQYSLVRDVVSALRRHRMHEQQFLHPPLLVLGNLGAQGGPELRLTAGMFQGMLPTLNVHRVNLNSIRRCLLISYEAESRLLELRHYSVQVVPVGLSRGIRKILQEKFPDLGRMDDVSQLLTGDAGLSESEAEPDGSQNVLELPQNCAGRGNAVTLQSAIRLTEIGPRLTLQLLKVEEGLGQGNVLYHGLAPKGEEELRELQVRRERRLQVRAERRRQQEQNLERKRQQRERHRERSLAGMGRAPGGPTGGPGGPTGASGGDSDVEDPGAPEAGEAEASDEDEAEYYRQELGEEPDTDLFPGCSKRKRSPSAAPRARKRRKRSPKSTPGTPKFTPGTPKSTPGTPKFTPGTPKSTPGTPKSTPGSQKFHPGTQKSHPGHPKNPKSHPGTPKSRPGNPKFHPGTPKFHPGSQKSTPGTPKSHPGSQKSTPGTPKSHPGHPKTPKSHPSKAGTPKSQRETPKSHPGHPKNPKSHPGTPKSRPGNPKFHPGTPKSQRGTPKSHPGSQKSTPGTPKSHPGHPKNPKSHPRKAGTPKSQRETPKSHPGHPKNPKSHRGKLLSPRKIPNFPRPGQARKRKN